MSAPYHATEMPSFPSRGLTISLLGACLAASAILASANPLLAQKPSACVSDGRESPEGSGRCCAGLSRVRRIDDDGNCLFQGPGFACTKCGDRVCGPGEDFCNCSKDCKAPKVPSCLREGEGSAGTSYGDHCCGGLRALPWASPYGVCPDARWFTCSKKCGNGLCEIGESSCNCSKDCPKK